MKNTELLNGTRVVELAGEAGALAGRILADLGAEVVRVEWPSSDPLRATPPFAADGRSLRYAAWTRGKTIAAADDDIATLLKSATIVLDTPGLPGRPSFEPDCAPQAHWIRITPFGLNGPRSDWQASDLGIMAASGNLFATGDPDRAPLRCSEPVAYAHTGPEAAFAALSALASDRPQVVDLSMQETILVANMGAAGNFPLTKDPGQRKGAITGRTREIWPCRDGFVSFGLRGGRARLKSLALITDLLREEGLANAAWTERDWLTYDAKTADETELRALEEPLAALFAHRSMSEWYALACETNLMLAPAAGAGEILGREQNLARDAFATEDKWRGLPDRIALFRAGPATEKRPDTPPTTGGCWEGLRVVEFGSGAAGPIAARYFAENGATVIKVESRERPDFLRAMWAQASPHGLEGSPLFAALNPGKKSITLDLKSEDGQTRARQLIHWADLVLENFAPRAMRGFGLDYDTMVQEKPGLVMVSTCLNGQTGPHRNYPGFGGQGSALAGYNFLTGWPDREPIGPYGTITDSLAPRFAATLAAAALLHHRQHGRGGHFDLSQVEAAQYSLAPWLLAYAQTGELGQREGNGSPRCVPHGVFPTRGKDRWIALACWTDEQWQGLAKALDLSDAGRTTLEERRSCAEVLEKAVAVATSNEDAEELAARLQAAGIEAVPVADFGDVFADASLNQRGHFQRHEHSLLGEQFYERNGFRCSDAPGGYRTPAPTLGEHDEELAGILES
jgi:crotonobetainyl-CoA:carnitine CoA-transferase CaiB-like acyl-CoA transferase